jgi:hypothetical protein
MHRTPIAPLLLAAVLAAPLAAQVPGGVRPAPRVQEARVGTGVVVVRPAHLQSLQSRLDGFAAQLPAEERALWNGVLLRAAAAPGPTGEVRVSPILEIGPGGGCEGEPGVDHAASRVAIVVQGGRTAGASGIVVQGGRTGTPAVQGPGRGGTGAPPAGTVRGANGPRPTPTGVEAIGPKQDDPGAPRPRTGAVAIGPKQDDPAPPPQRLGLRLAAFSAQLPAEERGALEWVLTRAAAAPEGRPGTPGGLPPGTRVSLRQALGIDVLAIGPKQDDPAPPPPAQRWILRY